MIGRGLPFYIFLKLISLSLPQIIPVILPIIACLSIYFVFSRMHTDRELIILQSSSYTVLDIIKPIIIFSTINRNLLSKLFAINIAENILNWIPKGTHDYNKLIKPEELKKTLSKENFQFNNIKGLVFDPFSREWKLSKNYMINYFCTASLVN